MSDPEREQKDREIKELKQQVAQLNQQLGYLTRQLFGKRSEKGIPDHPDQLDLFGEEETQSEKPEPEEAKDPPKAKNKKAKPKEKKPRLPKDLPIEPEILEPDEVKANPESWIRIGEEETDRLAYQPPRFYIKRLIRPKYVPVESGPDQPIAPVIAKLPPQFIERGIADASFAAHVLISKYNDHLPLDRQSKINRERFGIEISKQTLCNTVGAAAEWLRLIVEEMSRQAFDSGYVQIDETPINYLSPGAGKTLKGYFWAVHAPGGDTVYHWKAGRATEYLDEIVPRSFTGTIQCDGYASYTKLRSDRGNKIDLSGCLAHVRRKFWEALEQGQDPAFNRWVIAQFQLLYRIERKLRKAKASANLRLATRQSESRMIFGRIGRLLRQVFKARRFLPESLTGKAISYALNRWQAMELWLENGRLEIDNNLIENKIRPTKLGAKNWLFIGAEQAGWKSGVIYSIITSCKEHGIEPFAYLVDVLKRLPSMKTSEIVQIVPSKWQPLQTCS